MVADFKLFGNENPVVNDLGALTQGIGYPLRNVENFDASGVGLGDVLGPVGSVDNQMALFNGVTGKEIKNSSATVNAGVISASGLNASGAIAYSDVGDMGANPEDVTSKQYVDDAIAGITVTPVETIVLFASSFDVQAPGGLDTPLQLTFGGAQANAFLTLSAAGLVTLLQAGLYKFELRGAVGRESNPGAAVIMARSLINGSQLGTSFHANIPDSHAATPIFVAFTRVFNALDQWSAEIIRSSAGVNSGGMYPQAATIVGWANSPSVQLVITRLTAEVS